MVPFDTCKVSLSVAVDCRNFGDRWRLPHSAGGSWHHVGRWNALVSVARARLPSLAGDKSHARCCDVRDAWEV